MKTIIIKLPISIERHGTIHIDRYGNIPPEDAAYYRDADKLMDQLLLAELERTFPGYDVDIVRELRLEVSVTISNGERTPEFMEGLLESWEDEVRQLIDSIGEQVMGWEHEYIKEVLAS